MILNKESFDYFDMQNKNGNSYAELPSKISMENGSLWIRCRYVQWPIQQFIFLHAEIVAGIMAIGFSFLNEIFYEYH